MAANTSQTNPLATATSPNKPPRLRRIKQSSLGLPTQQEEFFHVQTKYGTPDGTSDPWQVRLLSFLNSKGMQHFLIGLLMLDVTILFIELALDAFFPSCYVVERDAVSCCLSDNENPHYAATESRLLGGGEGHDELCEAPLVETSHPAGCDDHKYHGVHVAHHVLFSFTILILSIFEVELLTMMYLIGVDKFFARVLYIVDLFIVTVSLVLEILFRLLHNQIASDLIGILIFFRLWRFVRIGHGFIASTYEMQEEKVEKWKEYAEELEKIAKRAGEDLPRNGPHHSDTDENKQEQEPEGNW